MKSALRTLFVAGAAGGMLFTMGAAPSDAVLSGQNSGVVLLVQDQQGQTISGRVVDNSGSPLSAFPVSLLKLNPRQAGGGGGGGQKNLVAQGKGPGDLTKNMYTKVDRTETDAEGNFKFENIKPGAYSVEIGDPDKLEAGYIKKGAKVEEGKNLEMGEIKVKPQAPRNDNKKGGKKGGR